MEQAGSRLRALVAVVNLGWAVWALVGGIYFLKAQETLGHQAGLTILHSLVYGFDLVGICLVICGVISLLSVLLDRFKKPAAIACAVWCGSVAIVMLFASPGQVDQTDVYAWLLMMCAFTCVMRWGLLVLEPHVC